MEQRVEAILPDVRFGPNGADPVFIWLDERGIAALALAPHFADEDQRHVVLTWHDVWDARMGTPNDEGRIRHPDLGHLAAAVSWIGEVHHSRWVASLAPAAPSVAGGRHFLVLDKETTFEVIASQIQVDRVAGPSLTAALEGCR